MSDQLPRQSDIQEDDDDYQIVINAEDIPPIEREYYRRLKTQRSYIKLSGDNLTIQQVQNMDNT